MGTTNKTSSGRGLILASGALLSLLIALLFLSVFIPVGFSAVNDTFEANVTVGNAAPSISNMMFNDTDTQDPNITLTAGFDSNYIMCNATITDSNGYQDVATSGKVNATFYHLSSSPTAADNYNIHYTNTSCSFSGGSGITVTALCTALFHHEASNGTWTCNITAVDGGGVNATGNASNTVEQLLALTVMETNISFGSMNNLQNSTSAQSTNITNQGNVKIDVQVKSNTDLTCSQMGGIGAGNISFNTSSGSYDSMYAGGTEKCSRPPSKRWMPST